jgi:protoheme IX farnesyltransferase
MSETTSRAHALHSPWSVRLSDYWAITKPGIAGAVLMTSVSSFLAGGGLAQADGWIRLFNMTLGTALTAFGAGALNMLWEAEPDALMDRTRNRPLPSGRMASQEALIFGILCGLLGIVHLVTTVRVTDIVFATPTMDRTLTFLWDMSKDEIHDITTGGKTLPFPLTFDQFGKWARGEE